MDMAVAPRLGPRPRLSEGRARRSCVPPGLACCGGGGVVIAVGALAVWVHTGGPALASRPVRSRPQDEVATRAAQTLDGQTEQLHRIQAGVHTVEGNLDASEWCLRDLTRRAGNVGVSKSCCLVFMHLVPAVRAARRGVGARRGWAAGWMSHPGARARLLGVFSLRSLVVSAISLTLFLCHAHCDLSLPP